MKTVTVQVTNQYNVYFDAGLINETVKLSAPLLSSKKVGIITDDIVDRLYAEKVFSDFKAAGYETAKFVFKNGEASKNINTLSDILEFLAENGFKRSDCLIAVGGGVVSDICGLAAALYMRGISFIAVPTTLLAAADASVGGKTAVDLKKGKNLAGAFLQPKAVICDTDIIKNLPGDIFREGMAEVIKCDVIREQGIIDRVLSGTVKDNIQEIIEGTVTLKRDIVIEDEFETKGIRKLLNVGHTVAHAIEKLSDYEISHGFAVANGLVTESAMACAAGICDTDTHKKIKAAVEKTGLLIKTDYSLSDTVSAMKSDKKNSENLISFMLPQTLGRCVEYKFTESEALELLKKAGEIL